MHSLMLNLASLAFGTRGNAGGGVINDLATPEHQGPSIMQLKRVGVALKQ
jgi:hypothetical protein